MLRLGLAATTAFVASCTAQPTSPVNETTTAPSTSAQPIAGNAWTGKLRSIRAIKRILGSFDDVFEMTSVSQVVTITNKAGATRLAVNMRGNSNQVQFIDPMLGVRKRIISLPQNLIAQGLAWDASRRTLYVGATNGHIYQYNYDTAKLLDLGRAAPRASSLYGLSVDSIGRLWGGSYPDGVVWNYSPITNKFSRLPRIDGNTDYVRAVAITADDTVYVGTGSTVPKVVCFPAAAPGNRTTLNLPALPPTGFVNKITVNGDHVLINASSIRNEIIWNHRTKVVSSSALSKARRQSTGGLTTRNYYWLNGGDLYSTNSTTGVDTRIGKLGTGSPEHMWVKSGSVYVMSRNGSKAVTRRFNLTTKENSVQSAAPFMAAGIGVRSLLAHTDGNIYIGGFLGQGIATLNPDTGERWQSPDTAAPNQISGMIQWDARKTYIGSYSSADIIRFTTPSAAEGSDAFKLLARLSIKYDQSRPIGWAKNTNRVFFGTVPDYGLAGGAMGIIDPVTDTIENVHNKIIANHSIVGLAADDDYVYGTTSTRNGMGLPDTKGDAKVFAFDLSTMKLAWSREISGYKAVMTPILVDEKIMAATIEGIVILNAANGALIKVHRFTNKLDRNHRPGWLNANVKRLGDTYRFAHTVSGEVHLLDILRGTIQKVPGAQDVGTAMAVTADGRLFVSHKVVGIAEIATAHNGNP